MKILVANRDRTADLGASIRDEALRMASASPSVSLPLELKLMSRRLSKSDDEYRQHMVRLTEATRAGTIKIGHRPGLLGAAVLRFRLSLLKFFCGPIHGNKPPQLPPEISSLNLQSARTEAEYQQSLIRLIRLRDAVDTQPFLIPGRTGFLGSIVVRMKAVLWKLQRYQFDRITFRQNLINNMITGTIEFEHALREQETGDLRRRVAELEKKLSIAAPATANENAHPTP